MTHYDVLGVRSDASQDEIRTAYRNMLKAFHPDYYTGDKAFAENQTQKIVDAYNVLRDERRRRDYDLLLKLQQESQDTPPEHEERAGTDDQQQEETSSATDAGPQDADPQDNNSKEERRNSPDDKNSEPISDKASFEWVCAAVIGTIMSVSYFFPMF